MYLHPDIVDAQAQLILDAIDAVGGPGLCRVYAGVQPAQGGAETTLLAEFVLDFPAGTVLNGVLTFAAPADTTGEADGTPTWARVMDRYGNWVADLTVGTDIEVTTPIVSGGVVSMLSMQFSSSN